MWKATEFSKTGKRNEDSGLQCQDCTAYIKKGALQAITLADGTGEDDFARMGAERSGRVLAQLLTEHYEELYKMEKSQVQFHVITNIQTELYRMCREYGKELTDLQSTLLGMVIDNEKKRFLAVHLGDGSIGITRKGSVFTISYPENGNTRAQTFLTSQHQVGRHIRVLKGEIGEIEEFILWSDGWSEKKMTQNQYTQEKLLRKGTENRYTDDIAFAALRRQ